ncbi:MAG: hypothetical protein K8J31_22955, partial [Anaerolineae bacterium]|nr:hypothetical protein [Anaerolineae bacterium]
TTLDMVGLTTPGAAAYWRNGPGSIAEFLIQERPDYIAAYGKGHGYGLELIANTPIYGDPLAEFPVTLDSNFNVALAADYQGIYQPDWDTILPGPDDTDPKTSWINVANIESEARFNYTWHDREPLAGFPTDIQALRMTNCFEPCIVVDGARRLNGDESFMVPVEPNHPLTLLTVLHPVQPGTLDVYVNDRWIDRNWIPEMPGWITFVPTSIPPEYVTSDPLTIRIVAELPTGAYEPLWHTVILEETPPEPPPDEVLVTYQEGAILLTDFSQVLNDNGLELNLHWYSDGNPEGDYRFFAHLYADPNEPPVAQTDRYPLIPPAPPGNWPPGPNWDRVMVDLSDVPPGTYQLAIGFYNPYTGERLLPESDIYEVSPDGRLWLGAVTMPADSDS